MLFSISVLMSIEDIDLIKQEIQSGKILIINLTPLARKSIGDVQIVVRELREFKESVGGDVARLRKSVS